MTEEKPKTTPAAGGIGPWAGAGFTVVLNFVSLYVLSRLPAISPDVELITQLVGATALIAGSILGWVVRERLKGFSLALAALGAAVVVLVTAIVCWLVQQQVFGASFELAVLYIVSGFFLCAALGVLLAIGGIAISDKVQTGSTQP